MASIPPIKELRKGKEDPGKLGQAEIKTTNPLLPDHQLIATQIIMATEKYYELPAGVLVGPSRNQQISHARKVAGQIMRDVTGMTWNQIGDIFKRHGVFFNAASIEMRQLIRQDGPVQKSYTAIRSSLGQN
jgi:chromosomal replication initiation ATPase DnaA